MKLDAQKRDTARNLSALRQEEMIPAICYGPDMEALPIQVQQGEFIRLSRDVSSSTIVDLDIEGEHHEVLIKEIDRHPVTELILHVDFYAIKRGAEMEIAVPIEFVGESPAVKDGGMLTEVMHELHVRCRPRNLPEQIEIDLSVLKKIGDHITVADVTLGEGVVAISLGEETIAVISEANEESEEEEEGTAEEMAEVLADEGAEEESEEK